MAICDWPEHERPREKLLAKGPHTLSDAELLAIFLRTGCKGKSAVDLARELISHFGSLRKLLESSQKEFCQAKGLGSAKYVQLQAVMEIARRHLSESITKSCLLNASSKVKDFLTAKLRHRRREVFAAIFLDAQHHLIAYEELFEGTVNAAAVYPREVLAIALRYNASSVIFAHNHPSGLAEPSISDESLTKTLKEALNMVDITTLDHMIVGEGSVYSFAEQHQVLL